MKLRMKARWVQVASCAAVAMSTAMAAAPTAGAECHPPAPPLTTCTAPYSWTQSLTFDPAAPSGVPTPNMGMNIVSHEGELYIGTSTNSEVPGQSARSSYVFHKVSTKAPWVLDTTFEPGTERVAAMESVTFERASDGSKIRGGPVSMVVAATNQNPNGNLVPVQARTRDDATGEWTSAPVSSDVLAVSQAREIVAHRDTVTGADLVFLAASPGPLGIYSGSYDAAAPGRIAWNPTPEIAAQSDRASEKWFGMAEANGALYASNNTGVFVRIDGPAPTWEMIADDSATGVATRTNPEFRGLTAVPNPKSVTGWPEDEMLIFSYANGMWRMRAGGDHAIQMEYDLQGVLESGLARPVPLAEAAFNRLNAVPQPDGSEGWLVGFDFSDVAMTQADPRALYLLRDERGNYAVDQIIAPEDPGRELILARDIVASPFREEPGVAYATGYNSSVSGDRAFNGRGWVYRGKPTARFDDCSFPVKSTGGADRLKGTKVGDRIKGGGGADRIKGSGGDDCLDGGNGADRLNGGAGKDKLKGGGGKDELNGGGGKDRLNSRGGGRDEVICGPGRDVVTADRDDTVDRSCEKVNGKRR